MKKTRFLSALTSLAMVGSVIASALPFQVSAKTVDSPTTMEVGMSSGQVEYPDGTYEKGFEATVEVVVNNYDEAETYTALMANIKTPAGVKVKSMEIVGDGADDGDPLNYFSTVGGFGIADMDFFATSVTDDSSTNPGFMIQGTAKTPFVKNTEPGTTSAVAKFVAVFDAGLKAGDYTLSFSKIEGNDSTNTAEDITKVYTPVAKPITFTLGKAGGPTDAPTDAPTEPQRDDIMFIGDIDITMDQVTGIPGETVTVGLKADTHGKTLTAAELKYVFDNALALVQDSGKAGKGFRIGAAVNSNAEEKSATYVFGSQKGVSNTATEYVVTFDFVIPKGAEAGTVYNFDISGTNGSAASRFTVGIDDETGKYQCLTPVMKQAGKITVTGATDGPTSGRDDIMFIGDIDITMDQVTGIPGETVTVGLKADTHGKTLTAAELKYVFDNALALVQDSGKAGKGFRIGAAVNSNAEEKSATYVFGSQKGVSNSPDEYVVTFDFVIPKGAEAGTVYDFDISGTNGSADSRFTVGIDDETGKYQCLTPVMKQAGKITVTGATDGPTDKPTDKPTDAPTDAPTDKPTEAPTQAPGVQTVTVIVTVPGPVQTVTVQVPGPVQTVTVPGPVQTVTVIVPVEGSIVTVPVPGPVQTVTVQVPGPVQTVTVQVPGPVQTVTVPGPVQTVTVTVLVPADVQTSTTTGGDQPTTTELVIDISGIDLNANDCGQWYHTDDEVFVKDGIKVFLGDSKEDIAPDAKFIFDVTPATVYDSKTNAEDYTVQFTVEYNGVTGTGEVPVKIGIRGDSDKNGKVNIFDAVRIAQSTVKKVTIKAGSFDEFRSDVDENAKINVFDAVNIAKYTVTKGSEANGGAERWAKIMKDYNKMIIKA